MYDAMLACNVRPTQEVYRTLMAEAYKRKRLDELWYLYEDMQSYCIKPEAITFNMLIAAATRAGLFQFVCVTSERDSGGLGQRLACVAC